MEPKTNIHKIQDIFPAVVRKLHESGLYYSTYYAGQRIPFGNRYIFHNNQYVNREWMWDDALKKAQIEHTNEFKPFPKAKKSELYAIACKLGYIKL